MKSGVYKIEEVTRYRTTDGKVFDSIGSASYHQQDLLFQRTEELLTMLFPDGHRPSILKAVSKIVDNPDVREKLLSLTSMIDSIL